MQVLRNLSIFFTKKNPGPAGEKDGRMIPAVSDTELYCFIASLSGRESE